MKVGPKVDSVLTVFAVIVYHVRHVVSNVKTSGRHGSCRHVVVIYIYLSNQYMSPVMLCSYVCWV